MAELFIQLNDFKSLFKLIKELNNFEFQKDDIEYFEILSLEIQYYTEKKNLKELKKLHEKSMKIKIAISHPKVLGVIKECAGIMYMRSKIKSTKKI